MDAPVQIRLFGAFGVTVGDNQVPESAWRLRKGKSLIKLLALAPDNRIHKDKATELLWPDREQQAAANNFHQALYVARRALENAGGDPASVLPLKDDMLALNPTGTTHIDVDEFEQASATARETQQLDDYRNALALHGGELLPEDRFEAWAAERREALDETHLALLLEYAALLGNDLGAAIDVLEQAVIADPLHEAAHRALMRLFARAGRRQEALAQYHRLRTALRRDLAADPDPQTARLYQAILRGDADLESPADRQPPGPAPEPRAQQTNLPIALTSFVGRGRELKEVATLLERNRLVTLTGAGGAGKTRLALEAARHQLDRHDDGVWLTELAGLADPALVPEAVASAFGLTLPTKDSALEELPGQIATKRALLVLDNCEHLISACARLAETLLATCPNLKVLATSREPLRLPGEVTWRVPSLALPDAKDPASLSSIESVRLFCVRAYDVAPSFALTTENAAPIAEICLRLDGMPLALELAAARTASLSPKQIADRLNDSLTVLTAGSRAALDRQQTLRATLNWSHDLLDDAEKALFRRLAVFAGGFSLEAAEAVTPADPITSTDIADLTARLVDKSLVIADDARSSYRYRLLEPMRQYAHEKLAEANELNELELRHYGFFLDLAAAHDPDLGSDAQPEQLEPDHDNLRAALAWALRHDSQQALGLAVHMWPMWMDGGHYQEGSRLLDAALAGAPEPTETRAEALRARCGLNVRLGDTAALPDLGQEELEIFRTLEDPGGVAHALDELGVYEYMVGHYDRGAELFEESLALAEELGDRKAAANALYSIGVLEQCRANFEEAREALLGCLSLLRALPAEDSQPFFRLHTVGLFAAPVGTGTEPRMYFEETLQPFRRAGARSAIGFVLASLGDVARAQGLREPARDRLNESLGHLREAGDQSGTAFVLNRLGILVGGVGEHDLGREYLEEALAIRRRLGDRRAVGMTLGNLGVMAARTGDLDRGKALLREALDLFEESHDAPGRMGQRLNLGQMVADAGEVEYANELLTEAGTWAAGQYLPRPAGWAALRRGELALESGDPRRAQELVDDALSYLRPLGDRLGLAWAFALGQAAAKWPLSAQREG